MELIWIYKHKRIFSGPEREHQIAKNESAEKITNLIVFYKKISFQMLGTLLRLRIVLRLGEGTPGPLRLGKGNLLEVREGDGTPLG